MGFEYSHSRAKPASRRCTGARCWGQGFPTADVWQCLETVLVITAGGWGRRCCWPRRVETRGAAHQGCPGQPPTSTVQPQMVAVPDRDALVMGRQHPYGLQPSLQTWAGSRRETQPWPKLWGSVAGTRRAQLASFQVCPTVLSLVSPCMRPAVQRTSGSSLLPSVCLGGR